MVQTWEKKEKPCFMWGGLSPSSACAQSTKPETKRDLADLQCALIQNRPDPFLDLL